jgi:hypothetical protein
MPTNRITNQFAPPTVANSTAMVACLAPVGMVVMLAAPPEQAAVHRQLYQLAQERARRDLAPPRHYRLLTNWN